MKFTVKHQIDFNGKTIPAGEVVEMKKEQAKGFTAHEIVPFKEEEQQHQQKQEDKKPEEKK